MLKSCAASDSGYLGAWCGVYSRKDPLEEGMATSSSILAWRIPWTEEPGVGGRWSQNVARDWSDLACRHSAGQRALPISAQWQVVGSLGRWKMGQVCSTEGSCKLHQEGPHWISLWHYLEGVQRCAEWEVCGGDSGGSLRVEGGRPQELWMGWEGPGTEGTWGHCDHDPGC